MRPRFFSRTVAELITDSESIDTTPRARPRPGLLIVGAGMMGCEHLRVAHLLGRAHIAGIHDTNAQSIQRARDAYRRLTGEDLQVFDSLARACASASVDAIVICTPNHTHRRVLESVATCGKPVLLEKPMATTLPDAQAIVTLAANHPTFIQLGMQYRFKAQYVDAFHEVKVRNSLGPVQTISMAEYRPPFLDKVGQWNKFNRYSGGTLVEKCCHYFDLINLMAEARPIKVFASGGRAVNFLNFEQDGHRSDIDDHAMVILEYQNGIRASFILNMFSQELYEEMVVSGPLGRLVASEQASFRPTAGSRARLQVEVGGHPDYDGRCLGYPAAIEQSGHYGATFFEHLALVDRLEGKPVDAATPEQALWSMVVASAAQHSMTTGKAVDIGEYCADQGLDLFAVE
ncbi:MAG: Gfo/Idh/MocA family protein [Steroidobacteraceae bacterium]